MRRRTRFATYCVALAVAGCLGGCGTLLRNPVPVAVMDQAIIPGMPDVRAPAGRLSVTMSADLTLSFKQESPADFPVGPDGYVHYAHLALSGGGPNGAFGAGFLKGWTKTGTRPVFKIVTGVSTGALMAPFAFLGPDYDESLHEFYTTTASRNIFRLLSIIPQLLGGESFADTGPLQQLIAQHVDAELLREIARAHQRGRRLYMGTTDLDSQSFVVWNMGLIAASGQPDALDLFRRVMLASASVPVAFPPVLFEVEVEADRRRYDEMHVDGGVVANVFYTGGVFNFQAARAGVGSGAGREDIFIIHNGQLPVVPAQTRRTLRSIALRVFDTATKAAFIGDLFRMYAMSLREQAGFFWITIPEGVELIGDQLFDPVLMGNLYDLGYRKAQAGPAWESEPPGVSAPPSP